MSQTKLDEVWTLTIDHKGGTTTRVFRTEEAANKALAEWARKRWNYNAVAWPEYTNGVSLADYAAMPDDEAVQLYFGGGGEDWFVIDPATVED